MLGLIPRDHWEHRLSDMLRGVAAAASPRSQPETLALPGLGACVPARSGRVAMVAALQALGLRPGARVGVPLFCCPVMFDAIAAAGAVPRFLDIDPKTFCLAPAEVAARRDELDALVPVHMFGNVCDLPALQKAAGGKPIIEDCAQALGSKLGGRAAGSFGSFGIFSFRAAKYLSVGEGGALVSSEADLLARAAALCEVMPAPSASEEFVHLATGYAKALLRSPPLYGWVGHWLWNARNQGKNPESASRISLGRVFKSDLACTSRRLAGLDCMVKRQRENAEFYTRTLAVDSSMLCWEQPGSHYNRYLYPITLPSQAHRDRLAARLLKGKVDTMKYLDGAVEVATKVYGYTGDCPVSEQLSKRVLTIPCHYALGRKETAYIAQEFNAAWAEAAREGRAGVPAEAPGRRASSVATSVPTEVEVR